MSKKFVVQSGILIMSMLVSCINAFPHLYANDGECAFEGECGVVGESGIFVPSGSGLMGMYIVESAGYVLDAHSAVLQFMNRYELAELNGADFSEMKELLSRAIDNLRQARSNYLFIHFVAQNTPYSRAVIDRLKSFDYDGFQKRPHIFPKQFDRLKGYLGRGDVRGIWSAISRDLDSLLRQLIVLKFFVDRDKFPPVQRVWKLNQAFSDNLFFGQYFAMVMYEVK